LFVIIFWLYVEVIFPPAENFCFAKIATQSVAGDCKAIAVLPAGCLPLQNLKQTNPAKN